MPDDLRELVLPALAHRLALPSGSQGGYSDAKAAAAPEAGAHPEQHLERIPIPGRPSAAPRAAG